MKSSPPRSNAIMSAPGAAAVDQVALPPLSTSASASASAAFARPAPACLAGSKRPAPSSLLPAFEPFSSSPALPRPAKRPNIGGAQLKYPTPVPTSSTGILSSSPPPRPALARTTSERAPLSAVPAVELPENGESLSLGRSSNSSHLQLSANRLVSRVHVTARYVPAPSPLETSKIEIVCHGWNGLKLHCQGRTWELFKGDSFTSETDGTDLMVDVLDARVMIRWPRRSVSCAAADHPASLSDSSWDDSPPRPQPRGHSRLPSTSSSPLRRTARIASPESPSPMGSSLSTSQRLQSLLPGVAARDDGGIDIYEDEPELPQPRGHAYPRGKHVPVGVSIKTDATASFSSDLSNVDDEEEEEEDDDDDGNNPDEENDPIVHSFGPFGANIAGRLASISTTSPKQPRPLYRRPHNASSNETLARDGDGTPSVSPSPVKERGPATKLGPKPGDQDTPAPSIEVDAAVANHVVNQLAFSRLASTPLSTIMQNLPSEQRAGLTKDVLRAALESTPCIGIIPRQGKDAAGKALESEYYYQPDKDDDEQRRAVVDALRKPSLRNCRKQHKQYYWKRPKTP
ncbi:uncharacterized protein UV8b_01056 [Ustilaginoidea virens]|uniref:FHA domain-containing protein n=1 Tax=Ustilaginoidea virens TaxID=1159556 RepID=A0A8E5HKA4_USTVR|nr:uncharacterized protein UV8b_01056 [Ustilaginoidea virens]QUC16815.1 hypothetical protein UV8b_01056 [Ustilaginoidea virens]